MPSSRGSSRPSSPTLQADSSPSEPPGKPENTGAGSLSLLQGNFLTQAGNPGLLPGRRVLYQLRHQGSPDADGATLQTESPEDATQNHWDRSVNSAGSSLTLGDGPHFFILNMKYQKVMQKKKKKKKPS